MNDGFGITVDGVKVLERLVNEMDEQFHKHILLSSQAVRERNLDTAERELGRAEGLDKALGIVRKAVRQLHIDVRSELNRR